MWRDESDELDQFLEVAHRIARQPRQMVFNGALERSCGAGYQLPATAGRRMFGISLPSRYHECTPMQDAGTTQRAASHSCHASIRHARRNSPAADVRAIAALAQLELDATQVELFRSSNWAISSPTPTTC